MAPMLVDDLEDSFEVVDAFELQLSQFARKWAKDIKKLILELKTLPKGKSLRRRFSERSEQQSFAHGAIHMLKKFGMYSEHIVSCPAKPEGIVFCVYVGRRLDDDEKLLLIN